MIKKSILFLFFISVHSFLLSQIDSSLFYKISWNVEKDKTNSQKYGDLIYSDNEVSIEYKEETDIKINFLNAFKRRLNNYPCEQQNLFIFIHGFGAHINKYVKINNSIIHYKMLQHDSLDFGVHVSLIWQSTYEYWSAKKPALSIGYFYADLIWEMNNILKSINPNAKLKIMSHSMGNRIFEGIFHRLLKYHPTIFINDWLSVSPDLESKILSKHGSLEKIDSLVKNTTVYIHNNDRVLGFAEKLVAYDRLGLHGVNPKESLNNKVTIIDASIVANEKVWDIGNHRYYYQSAVMREEIKSVIFELEKLQSKNRKKTKVNQYFLLNSNI